MKPVKKTYNKIKLSPFTLDDIDKKLIEIQVKFKEYKITDQEFADVAGIRLREYYERINRPSFKLALIESSKGLNEHFNELQILAMRKLKQLVVSPDPRVALQAAKLALTPFFTNAALGNGADANAKQKFIVTFGDGGEMMKEFKNVDDVLDKIHSKKYSNENTIDVTPQQPKELK